MTDTKRDGGESGFPDAFEISDEGDELSLDDVLTGRGFVTGKSGSGKSNTASVIAEEILELGLPLLVVDADGEYRGLKESFEILHVGADDSCDVVVSPNDAEELARVAIDENVPVILDISGYLEGDTVTELVASVLRHLFRLEGSRRKPFLVVVEEIHEFVPQSGGLDELGELLIQVVKRGRKRGLGICGLSQRPAAVDKEFITQCDWMVWHRLTWESDVDVVRRFLAKERADSVDSLADGEAFVVTDWDDRVRRIRFRRKRTYDAGATPTLDDVSRPEFDSEPIDAANEFASSGGSEDTDDEAATESDSAMGGDTAYEPGARDGKRQDPPKNRGLVEEGAELIAFTLRAGVARAKDQLSRKRHDSNE